MMQPPTPRGGIFGGLFDREPEEMIPAPSRSNRPPLVWGSLEVEGEELVARVTGWRSVVAMRRRLAVPLSSILRVEHDPAVRAHVRAKLRRRGGQSGLMRVGPYHSLDGWSFWSVGLGRNAVVVETEGERYRYVIVEVADPAGTVSAITEAAGLAADPGPPSPAGGRR